MAMNSFPFLTAGIFVISAVLGVFSSQGNGCPILALPLSEVGMSALALKMFL